MCMAGSIGFTVSMQPCIPCKACSQAHEHEHTWVQDSVLVGDVMTKVLLGRRFIVVRGQQVAHGVQWAGQQWLANNTGGRVGHFFAGMNYRFAPAYVRTPAGAPGR